jgi:hypothetical protein
VLDIGARTGQISRVFATAVGDTGAVLAFESRPARFRLLSANAMLNKFNQLHPVLGLPDGIEQPPIDALGLTNLDWIRIDALDTPALASILRHGENSISNHKPGIMLSGMTHLDSEIKDWLDRLGYGFQSINSVLPEACGPFSGRQLPTLVARVLR